jgi:tetratricopeptide (TPR) repeat protein
VSGWTSPHLTRRQRSTPSRYVNKVHRISRVFSALLILTFIPVVSLAQTTPDRFDANSLEPPVASRISESSSQDLSSHIVSVNQLRVPGKAADHLEVAQKRFAKMQLAQATVEIDRAIAIYPGFAQAFCMKALVQLAGKDFTGSVENAAHAVSLEVTDAYSWVALATAFNSLNEWPEAGAAAGQALALNPLAWQARLELAKSFYGQGKFVLALSTLDHLSQSIPDIYLVRGNSLVRIGRAKEAAQQFSIFLQQAPADSRAQQIREIVNRLQATQN